MKKILVSLVLIFGLFFSFSNVNAQFTKKEKQQINKIVDNFLIKTEKKYGKEKTIEILKKIIYKIKELEKNPKFSNKLDILNYLFNKIEYFLDQKIIEKYFYLLENGNLYEAEKMIGEKIEELVKLKNLIKGKSVKISVFNFKPLRETTFSYNVKINFLENGKIEYYSVVSNIGNFSGLSEYAKKNAGLIRFNNVVKLTDAEEYCVKKGGSIWVTNILETKKYKGEIVEGTKEIKVCHTNNGLDCKVSLYYKGECGK